MKKRTFLLFLFIAGTVTFMSAQITQTVRGTVIDKDSKMPLIGATIAILTAEPIKGTTTDFDGSFKIEEVNAGRHNIEITYLGYEPVMMSSMFVKSGKETVLNVEMIESAEQLAEVVVSAASQADKTKPLNEFAVVSARTFSVEETSRYASSNFDPSRMAQNYAGVSVGSGSDLFNEIVIRGNSPAGVLWRLEGIQIPNPNHFSSMGNSGGAISMLSSSTLSNSDFYTGAFPSEFGSALSGVFDLNMRNGNNEKREHSVMIGLLGIEIATEGPFSKKSKGSYLINYRYSTLAVLDALGVNPGGDVLPAYQDLSFKFNMPTEKAGTFSLFGLGGNNISTFSPEADSTKWTGEFANYGFEEKQKMGTIGLSNRLLLTEKSYLKTVAVASYEQVVEDEYFLEVNDNYKSKVSYRDDISTATYRVSSTYNHKLNAKNSIRAGAILSYFDFGFENEILDEETDILREAFNNSGSTGLLQGFAHWKHRFNKDLTLNAGVHYTQMTLNNKSSIEPRAALQWRVNPKQTLSFSAGLHSKMEHLGIYLFEGKINDDWEIKPKTNLGLTKAFHGVVGYDFVFNPQWRLKAEAYYQHLYDIPVSADKTSTYSIVNATDVWDVIGLEEAVAEGTGRNIGLDLTIEKFFAKQYYLMMTGSLYDSKYTASNGKEYNTRFNGSYQFNMLGGKEFTVGKKKNKTLGINGKFVLSGGNRFTPLDLVASEEEGESVRFDDRPFEQKTMPYYRFDIGISYKINTKRMTHSIMLDIQNVTARENVYAEYYDGDTNTVENYIQTGLFPNFNYRVEF